VKILIAEDDPVSSKVLEATLTRWGHEVVITRNGVEAWDVLHSADSPMFAILDWMMPGMDGVEICRKVRQEITDSPPYLILLTAMQRKEDLIEGLDAGADDYLTKPFNRQELRVRVKAGARIVELQNSLHERVKELEEAIVQKEHAEEALRNLTLTDHMTGLYNYRGFFTLAEHHAKIARRSKKDSLLLYADMDGLKEINDTLGHAMGSMAIVKVAEILRQTFRDCDVIARLGGDEFAVLAPNLRSSESRYIIQRLHDNLQSCNEQGNSFQLSLSIGTVTIRYDSFLTIEEHIAKADKAMYKEKRGKKRISVVVPEQTTPFEDSLLDPCETAPSH
jgi:diguanylate cyclase (GGDEF)-like protein